MSLPHHFLVAKKKQNMLEWLYADRRANSPCNAWLQREEPEAVPQKCTQGGRHGSQEAEAAGEVQLGCPTGDHRSERLAARSATRLAERGALNRQECEGRLPAMTAMS